jgi:DNA-binding MarR family transcriptional regulator
MNAADSQTFVYLLFDVMRLLRKHFDRRAAPLGLTRAQWRALKAIHREPGQSQAELAEFLEMEAIPVGRVIDRLVQAGFVERRADPNDRRRWRLHHLPKARGVLDTMETIGAALRAEALADVDQDDHAAMLRALETIKANLVALDEPSEKK